MKYFIRFFIVFALCLLSFPAHSQMHAENVTQTTQESDEWAQKIENLIKLYAAEGPRDYIKVEDVKDYSLDALLRLSFELIETSVNGDEEALLQYYLNKAQKAKNTQHVKLAHIYLLGSGYLRDSENNKTANFFEQLEPYIKDEDFIVAFTAENIRLRQTMSSLGANLAEYSSQLDSYKQIRTLLPSPNHTYYKYYRYMDAIISALIMSRGDNIKASYQAHQEADYFAQELGLRHSYYSAAHNLIYLHERKYIDTNSNRLIQKLYNATQHDEELNAYASHHVINNFIRLKEYSKAQPYLKKMSKLKGMSSSSYFRQAARVYLYSGNLEQAKTFMDSYFKVIEATNEEIENHKFITALNLLEEIEPEQRGAVLEMLQSRDYGHLESHIQAWRYLTKSYVHSLGVPTANSTYMIKDIEINKFSEIETEELTQTIQLLKAPNILINTKSDSHNPGTFNLVLSRVQNRADSATHYSQNSDFYKTLVRYDYIKDLVFQQSDYINTAQPKPITLTPSNRSEVLQINIFTALHHLYVNDTQKAWQVVANISAEIARSESNYQELDYQLDYVKFLLFTKEQNLHLATQAAHNHITKAIDLKQPINEAAILESFIYLLYQSKHYDEALVLLDDAPKTMENDRSLTDNIDLLKALLLTETHQHSAALAHAQIHDSNKYSDENEVLFQSLKYLNQASMGELKNAALTKQVLSNLLARTSNIKVQNIAHLNIARAQIELHDEKFAESKNNANTIASTLERNRQIEIAKIRNYRDQANLQKDITIRSHLNNSKETVEENRSHKRNAYLISSLFALLTAFVGIKYFRRSKLLLNNIISLRQKQEETERVYDHLSTVSTERVSAMRRNLKTIKDSHFDEATLSSLSIAINEADTLLEDIKRTKIRSRLATSLDATAYTLFDPHKYRKNMLPIWMQKLKSKNVTITFNCDPKLSAFETDAEILMAAVEEIVTKAINATLFGSIIIDFNVSRKLSKHILSINITDTGDSNRSYVSDDLENQAVIALNGSLNHNLEIGVGCTVKATLPIKMSGLQINTPQNSNVVAFKP